jgi:hypothetical protein
MLQGFKIGGVRQKDWCLSIRKKGFNSFVILVAWQIWKHRNACVFDNASPNIHAILLSIHDEALLWGLGGAAALRQVWL